MRRALPPFILALLIAVLAAVPAGATRGSRWHEATASRYGIVVTESPAASRVGREVLERGGNAIDAAVATVFALGVARPQSCGIGGGGFLLYRSASGKARALDFRETAPAAIRADQYVDDPLAATFTGHTTVGVPGTVAGMDAALARYGTLTLREAIAPAEALARGGVAVPTSLSGSMTQNADRLKLFPAAAAQYLKPDGSAYRPQERLVQPVLAATLRRIMRGGPKAFYAGTIARRIVADMRAARPTADPGLLTLEDLAAYRARWRAALTGTYRGSRILAEPPPTSGGIAILEMLNLLEGYDLKAAGQASAQDIHLTAEAQNVAWADRNAYVADPAFVPVPTQALISKGYAAARRAALDPAQATVPPPGAIPAATPRAAGGEENPEGSTTQVSIVDAKGAAVSLTCTIEQEFGSAVVAPGTGFLLNNELTDFGGPGTANQPAPGKRPRSSMAPTIVVRGGRPVLVAGGAGGALIIMGVLHTILDTTDFGASLADAVDAERWDTGGSRTLSIEDARVMPGALDDLRGRGWTIKPLGEYGPRPRIQLAGAAPSGPGTVGVSDSRSDHAALAQRRPAASDG
ncbi:MAG: gamma-glutamyltranspeptidase / glutathione hydrolase [Solirubrobacteraceae bacterium]|nr:gamma-glutamyltranspeptidase / glutathione hydrolase [Solirubrobacteraceae bacterium]